MTTTANPALPMFGHSVFYAYLIKINNQDVGTIQKMSTRGQRESYRVGEVRHTASDALKWKEILWGYETVTLDLSHLEFYGSSFLQALGGDAYVSLRDFNFCFDILEIQHGYAATAIISKENGGTGLALPNPRGGYFPAEGAIAQLRVITYAQCVPVSYSKSIDRGTIQVVEDMSVECTYVKKTDTVAAP